jgi:hypothetical protein
MPSNSARMQVGRLLEIRADAGYRTRADVDALFDMMEREISKLPPLSATSPWSIGGYAQ